MVPSECSNASKGQMVSCDGDARPDQKARRIATSIDNEVTET